MLVEVGRKSYLASIVPVIVDAILNEHQIVVDIVAFVNRGDFPRSRLGEKQRGKILASWVTRKMRTMAQFGIRDPDSALSDVTETIEPRSHLGTIGSVRNGSAAGSSLRNMEPAPKTIEQREYERQPVQAQNNFAPLPTGISEMPAQNYNDSIVGSPTTENGASLKSDDTPTDNRKGHFELPSTEFDPETDNFLDIHVGKFDDTPDFGDAEAPNVPPPRVGPKPTGKPAPLPAVEGREGDLWSLPSQSHGGLRVQNASSDDEDDAWKSDAIMHMNLAGR